MNDNERGTTVDEPEVQWVREVIGYSRHCGQCNNPTGVFNLQCRGPHEIVEYRRRGISRLLAEAGLYS